MSRKTLEEINKKEKYGMLQLTGKYKKIKNYTYSVEVKCDCGNVKYQDFNGVKAGRIKSCGCQRIVANKKKTANKKGKKQKKPKPSGRQIIRDIVVFCERKNLLWDKEKMTIDGLKIFIKGERFFYSHSGKNVIAVWYECNKKVDTHENTGDIGYKAHFQGWIQ